MTHDEAAGDPLAWRWRRSSRPSTAGRRFYDDDPIAREPDTQDASRAEPVDIGLLFDLTYDLFVTGKREASNTRARNVNTIDEVPDSSWFTNRIGARAVTADEIARGPALGTPPAPERWVIIREKTAGVNPGFTARDANGETWFLSFDAPESPDGSTAEVVVASKLFWALGYNQVEMFLTTFDPAPGRDRSRGDQSGAVRRTDRVHARTTSTRCWNGRRATRMAPIGPRRDACCPGRSSAASATRARAPTTRTTSSRTSTAANCARCTSSARGRT